MRPTWPLWSAFSLCLAVVLAAMAWISVTAINLDESETRARRQAVLEENVCLALWRIDSALSPILAQESARPYIAYKRSVPPGRAAWQSPSPGMKNEELVSSPISMAPYVLVHFQFEPDGQLTSPSIPAAGTDRLPPSRPPVSDESAREARRQLDRILALTDRQRLAAMLPRNPFEPMQVVIALARPAIENRQAAGRAEMNRQDRGANDYQLRNQTVTNNYASQFAQNSANTVATNGLSSGTVQGPSTRSDNASIPVRRPFRSTRARARPNWAAP